MPFAAGSSLSSASSSAPDPVPISSRRSCSSAQAAAHDEIERGFDHRFGFRPRHQNVGRDVERQAPEFLAAENARHRLTSQSARDKRRHRIDFTLLEDTVGLRDELCAIETQRVAEQGARIHLGRIDSGGFEGLRDQAKGIGNTGAGLQPRDNSHVAPSAASNSA